jgi:hypothetical protein
LHWPQYNFCSSKYVTGYLLITNIRHYDLHVFPRTASFWVIVIQNSYFKSENQYSSIDIFRTIYRIYCNQSRTVSLIGPLYKIVLLLLIICYEGFHVYVYYLVTVSKNHLGAWCSVSFLYVLNITIHPYKNPLFCSEMMKTCGGSGASSKGSTWKGQTYRSGCPLLDKLQSYNLLSSSIDNIVNDSYKVAEISNSN